MKIIAFYTEDTPYELLSQELENNLVNLNLSYSIQGIPNQGSWIKNCAMKPIMILQVLKDSEENEEFFYVDVDGRFMREPSLLLNMHQYKYDMGVCYLGQELLSGSIYLKNTKATRDLVQKWCDEQFKTNEFDQLVLQRLIYDRPKELRILHMPEEYCTIFDTMAFVLNPVVVHYQASRMYRDDHGEADHEQGIMA